MQVLHIALDVPINQLFSYISEVNLPIGTRVVVDFRSRKMVGFVWEVDCDKSNNNYDINKLKPILTIFPEILDPQIISLTKFVVSYYHCPIGQAIFMSIPLLMRKASIISWSRPHKYSLTPEILANPPKFRSKKQQQLFEILRESSLFAAQIKELIGVSYLKLIKLWQEQGILISIECVNTNSHQFKLMPPNNPDSRILLNTEQKAIIEDLTSHLDDFHPCIIYGITGSGKTEVYLELINQVISSGKQALVLVPEINLTPQLLARFKKRFSDIIIYSLTSSSSDKERLAGYFEALIGDAQIIIGTRLSVFTPFKNLGIIIVDEEHDHSFKQNDGIRYHARDIAVWRGSKLKIPVVMGSATPSLESLYNFKLGKYKLYKLNQRAVESSVLPEIKLIDLNAYSPREGLSDIALAEIKLRLDLKEISLVFINRRGHSPVISCYECGWISNCSNCSINMVYHSSTKNLKCHHCGLVKPLPQSCPMCNNVYLQAIGQGTQKVETILRTKFPDARIYRIDQDTTQTKNSWNELYNKIHNNEVDILVGTQMLSKGHDFHNITLVVGLNIDSGLYGYDFRASELLFRQLIQVSGRAGRGNKEGLVLLQTHYPKHDLYQYLIKHDFSGFVNYLLTERKPLNLPPYSHYVLLRASSLEIQDVMVFLAKVVELGLTIGVKAVHIGAPVTSMIQRLKNKERGQLLIYSNQRDRLHQFLNVLEQKIKAVKIKSSIAWYLDIDPLEL